jgi:hypothetical protein
MKKVLSVLCLIVFCASSGVHAEQSTVSKQKLVVSNKKEGVYLYATPNPDDDLYTDFRVKIGNKIVETFGWKVSMRAERQPELHVIDLNQDGKKEIVVIITKGAGDSIVLKEAHIIQQVETMNGIDYDEVDIDNPVHTIERDFQISATDKTIQIKGRGQVWKADNPCGQTFFHHRFPLNDSVNWKVEGNTLVADVGLILTSKCIAGGFLLKYKQKGEIYTADQIKVIL